MILILTNATYARKGNFKMKYITIDVLPNGQIQHKDWVPNAVCSSRFSHLIRYIVEEEIDDYIKTTTFSEDPNDEEQA